MNYSEYDPFMSHRGYNEYCKWWRRDNEYEQDELVMKRPPSGTFYAKEITPETNQSNVVGGVFLLDQNTVTIRSPDRLDGMKKNDIVLYQDEKWIVVTIQKLHHRQSSTEFLKDKDLPHFWTIQLRK